MQRLQQPIVLEPTQAIAIVHALRLTRCFRASYRVHRARSMAQNDFKLERSSNRSILGQPHALARTISIDSPPSPRHPQISCQIKSKHSSSSPEQKYRGRVGGVASTTSSFQRRTPSWATPRTRTHTSRFGTPGGVERPPPLPVATTLPPRRPQNHPPQLDVISPPAPASRLSLSLLLSLSDRTAPHTRTGSAVPRDRPRHTPR